MDRPALRPAVAFVLTSINFAIIFLIEKSTGLYVPSLTIVSVIMIGLYCGLGLAIVKDVVEVDGGKIDVESSQDTGTTFALRLPIREMKDSKSKGTLIDWHRSSIHKSDNQTH